MLYKEVDSQKSKEEEKRCGQEGRLEGQEERDKKGNFISAKLLLVLEC